MNGGLKVYGMVNSLECRQDIRSMEYVIYCAFYVLLKRKEPDRSARLVKSSNENISKKKLHVKYKRLKKNK